MTRLVLIAVLLVACSKKKEPAGPSCDQVTDHVLALTKQAVPGHDTVQMGNRKQMIEQCEQRKFPAEMRSCLVASKSLEDLSKCRKASAPTTAPAPAPTPAPAPPAPAPTPDPAQPSPTGSAGSGSG
jgi:hypothetical protein